MNIKCPRQKWKIYYGQDFVWETTAVSEAQALNNASWQTGYDARFLTAIKSEKEPQSEKEIVMNHNIEKNKNMYLNLQEVLRLARGKNESFNEISVAIGRNDGYLTDLVHKPTTVRATTYRALANHFNVPVESIVLTGYEGKENTEPEYVQAILYDNMMGEAEKLLSTTQMPEQNEIFTAQEDKILKMVAIWNDITPEEVKDLIVKRYIGNLSATDAIMDLKL